MAFKPEYLLWPFTEKICGSLLSAWEGNLAFMGHPQTVFLVLFSSFQFVYIFYILSLIRR